MFLTKLAKSSSLRAAMGFGMGGVAFALGNLLLARSMPVSEYGRYALAVAIYNIFWTIAALGFDEASLRHSDRLDRMVFVRIIISGVIMGGVACVVGHWIYGLDAELLLLLGVAIVAGGLSSVASAMLRREGQHTAPLLINNAANWAVMTSALASLALDLHTAVFALAVLMMTVTLAAAVGWVRALQEQTSIAGERQHVPLREAVSFVSIVASGSILLQLERMVAPMALGVDALASFAVLASVALFPYRMLRAGAIFSLVPKLRGAANVQERNHVLVHELGAVLFVLVGASIGVLLLSSPLTYFVTGGKYELPLVLVGAACINGAAKVIAGVQNAVVTACGTESDVASLKWLTWVMITGGVTGAWMGSVYGLAGLVAGAGVGSLIGALPGMYLAYQVLRREQMPEGQASPMDAANLPAG
ncbi:MAG: oligosaccharide flippase family protein [Sphingomonadaceae bacterium]